MAQVVWAKQAIQMRFYYMRRGRQEFGELTAASFSAAIDKAEEYISKYPTTGYIETSLEDLPDIYRVYLWH